MTSNKSVITVAENWIPENIERKKKIIKHSNNFDAGYLWLDIADLSHSAKIISGLFVQGYIKEIVINSPIKLLLLGKDLIQVSNLAMREADLIFMFLDVNSKIISIIYREVKINAKLDSEKMPATLAKIDAIKSALEIAYGVEVNSGFLCPSYLDSTRNKNDPKKNIEGFNDFIQLLGYDLLSFTDFEILGKMLGKQFRNTI